mgnify:CR=1 FL=1|tara:strand:+ start:93 stop:704 length:612 start_codon:yes stop_codon:yes gene_type:complete
MKMEQLLLHKGPLVHINHSHRTATFSLKPFYTGTDPQQQPHGGYSFDTSAISQMATANRMRQEQANREFARSMSVIFANISKRIREEIAKSNDRFVAVDALMDMSKESDDSPLVINQTQKSFDNFLKGVEAYIRDGEEQGDHNVKMIYRYLKPMSKFPKESNWDATLFVQMPDTEYNQNMKEVVAVFMEWVRSIQRARRVQGV